MTERRDEKGKLWPNDVRQAEVPIEAMDAAQHETYRFLYNYWVWKGDLRYLCAICYLQGAIDGAQVQAILGQPQEGRR